MKPARKIASSSTAWFGVGLLGLQYLAASKGWSIPTELLAALAGAYGIKEAGAHLAARPPPSPPAP